MAPDPNGHNFLLTNGSCILVRSAIKRWIWIRIKLTADPKHCTLEKKLKIPIRSYFVHFTDIIF